MVRQKCWMHLPVGQSIGLNKIRFDSDRRCKRLVYVHQTFVTFPSLQINEQSGFLQRPQKFNRTNGNLLNSSHNYSATRNSLDYIQPQHRYNNFRSFRLWQRTFSNGHRAEAYHTTGYNNNPNTVRTHNGQAAPQATSKSQSQKRPRHNQSHQGHGAAEQSEGERDHWAGYDWPKRWFVYNFNSV